MAEAADAPKADKKLLAEVEAGKQLKHAKGPGVDLPMQQAKVQMQVQKGVKLKEAEKPKEGPSDAVKEAFLADRKDKAAGKDPQAPAS